MNPISKFIPRREDFHHGDFLERVSTDKDGGVEVKRASRTTTKENFGQFFPAGYCFDVDMFVQAGDIIEIGDCK